MRQGAGLRSPLGPASLAHGRKGTGLGTLGREFWEVGTYFFCSAAGIYPPPTAPPTRGRLARTIPFSAFAVCLTSQPVDSRIVARGCSNGTEGAPFFGRQTACKGASRVISAAWPMPSHLVRAVGFWKCVVAGGRGWQGQGCAAAALKLRDAGANQSQPYLRLSVPS